MNVYYFFLSPMSSCYYYWHRTISNEHLRKINAHIFELLLNHSAIRTGISRRPTQPDTTYNVSYSHYGMEKVAFYCAIETDGFLLFIFFLFTSMRTTIKAFLRHFRSSAHFRHCSEYFQKKNTRNFKAPFFSPTRKRSIE